MANQVTIKQDSSVKGLFKANAFNEQGQVVPGVWQEFDVNANMVWDPAKYGYDPTPFYIAKGIGPDKDNQNVAYEVFIDFSSATENATVTLGIAQVPGKDGGSGCYYFTAKGDNVEVKIIKNGVPVGGTELPSRCS